MLLVSEAQFRVDCPVHISLIERGCRSSNIGLLQDPKDVRVLAKDLVGRSLMQMRGDKYLLHDSLLDFVKGKIKDFPETKTFATSHQSEYLGRLDVLKAYSDRGEVDGGFFSLIALWKSLEKLSDDALLQLNTYSTSLCQLENIEVTPDDGIDTCASVARSFDLQVMKDAREIARTMLTVL